MAITGEGGGGDRDWGVGKKPVYMVCWWSKHFVLRPPETMYAYIYIYIYEGGGRPWEGSQERRLKG